jgi:prepilin-type N-terminal cleavage/methylation domain-containing protein
MGSRIISSKPRHAGFTLVEVMVASSLGLVVTAAILSLSYYSTRSFVAINNYLDLNRYDQLALDQITRDIRQATAVSAFPSATNITLLDYSGQPLQYLFDPNARTLVRVKGGQQTTYLTDCDALTFALFQRTPMSNTFDCYNVAGSTNAKLVELSWTCSRTILGAKVNSETMQSSKIALRRK